MKKRVLTLLLCIAMCVSMVSMLAGCKDEGGSKPDAFVIMTDLLDGLFNPFYYTSANDGTIVSQTQISMIGAKYVNGKIEVAYGENEAVVAKDYEIVENADGTVSYYFVLKNGIKYSDGHPLTMEDVLFNYYVYLDPVYTGSNTLYSTKILGLQEYRTQTISSGSNNTNELIAKQASDRATARMMELVKLFQNNLKASASKEFGVAAMTEAIGKHNLSNGYKEAISNDVNSVTNADLLNDYNYALKLFREELERDYDNAQESYDLTAEPYKSWAEFQDPVFRFMAMEGYVSIEYAKENGKTDRSKIVSIKKNYPAAVTDKTSAVDYIFNDKTATEMDIVLMYWATGTTMLTEFTAKATEVILHANIKADGSLAVPNISGLVSLGHTDAAGTKLTINGTEYTVASGHNADGTVTNTAEHDILKITIDGVDPKAIWNFSLTIAPQHYYGQGSSVAMDIADNKFGVEFASFKFMTEIIQSTRNIKLPMGAGPYKVTDNQSSDNPTEGGFFSNNIVYLKANNNFETVGEGINNAKINLIRYQVISSNDALSALEKGTVHYVSPSLTTNNFDKLTAMKSKGFEMLSADQLGYGYVGINASKVPNLYLRRAIMCAMNTSLALDYYRTGTAEQIVWNMSKVSWAYPTGEDANYNGKDYPQYGTFVEQTAKDNIEKNMQLAASLENIDESDLKITFTIAGSTLQDHPTYKVFRDAAALLNSMGWDVEVVCDTNALTKINTGSLQVWAAAWSSSLDPDMYQVYHKDSTATSTKAWGYDWIKKSGSSEEVDILNELADLIDQARETNNQAQRAEIYQEAMGLILDLAVELPVYQRDVLYAYNANVINSATINSEVNPYSTPLDRIWEIEFVN